MVDKKSFLWAMIGGIVAAFFIPIIGAAVQTYVLPTGSTGQRTEMLTNAPNRDEANRSSFSGTAAPSSPSVVAGQHWMDTNNDQMKYRNAANSAWVPIPRFDQSNTWTANQRIDAGLGVNVAPPATGNFAISGTMTSGVVPLSRVGASFDLSIPSTANGATSSNVTLTHNLGTDDVIVLVQSAHFYQSIHSGVLGWRGPDDGGTLRLGLYGIGPNAPVAANAPASGNIVFFWRNDIGSSMAPTFKINILRRS